jgi:L,D-transpeptidase ErfK/SrfK
MNTFFKNKGMLTTIAAVACLLLSLPAFAKTFALPEDDDNLIGQVEYVSSNAGETLLSIAQRFNLGLNVIEEANPGIGPVNLLPAGMHVKIPGLHLLPPLPRKGIVINLPEMRMYYYPSKSEGIVMTYPIGIGRVGKTIPLAKTAVVRKAEHPVWIPTPDIRAFNKEQGITLPKVMPAGPDNPLGPYAIYLRIPTYLIHSTIYPDSIGRRASFGCIRMNETDIKDFFPLVTAGTPVTIVDMPNKLGWAGDYLFLETHEPLSEHSHESYAGIQGIINSITTTANTNKTFIDWQLVADMAETRDGIPQEIGFRIN